MNCARGVLALGVFLCLVVSTLAMASRPQSATSSGNVLSSGLSSFAAPTNHTPTPEEECANAISNSTSDDSNCNACVSAANGQCFYCYTDHKCRAFFTKNIFHTPDECEYTEARIWTCAINLQVLAITLMSIVGCILGLILICCCYCCCCRRSGGSTRWEKELKR